MTDNIQFQRGLSLIEFMKLYGQEGLCEAYLEKTKWGKGFECSKCQSKDFRRITYKDQVMYRCKSCKHRNSLKQGTLFENTKLPLTKWFLAIYFLTQGKKGISALDLMRKIDVNKNTAWLMRQKILATMSSREEGQMLDTSVQIDDVYSGGKKEGKAGRGAENKQAFLACVSVDESGNPFKAKFAPVKSFTQEEVENFAKQYIAKGTQVKSDGLGAFNFFSKSENYLHDRVKVHTEDKEQKKENFELFNAINTLISNLKNFISGIHHNVTHKYLQNYFFEFQYRFNRRFDLKALWDRFMHTAINLFQPLTLSKIQKRALC